MECAGKAFPGYLVPLPLSSLQVLFLFVILHLHHQRPSRLLALCAGLELLYFLYLSWSENLVFFH